MPQVLPSSQTAALGVTIAQLSVEEHLGWIFRRVTDRDTGLDAEVEVVLGGSATGLLLGVQVKAGRSYFAQTTERGWRYKGDNAHLDYWTEHRLPVVVLLVDTETKAVYWAPVTESASLSRGEKTFLLEVPSGNRLDSAEAAPAWFDLAWSRSPVEGLFRYVASLDRYLRTLDGGGRVFVECDKWVNKTRGQAQLRLVAQGGDGSSTVEDLFFFAGIHDVLAFIEGAFPWAAAEIDEEFYAQHEDEPPPEAVFQDDDEPSGYFVVPGRSPSGPRPYRIVAGEVAKWRFELSINELGSAYLSFVKKAGPGVDRPPYLLARLLK